MRNNLSSGALFVLVLILAAIFLTDSRSLSLFLRDIGKYISRALNF